MDSLILSVIIGIVIVMLGVNNRKGNISSVHSYHRKRVTEEDRLAFGRLVGTGTIIVGIAVILMGCLNFAADQTGNEVYATFASVIIVLGLVLGLGLNVYAMMKYNKGIF